MTPLEYFGHKIKAKAQFYSERAKLIDDRYLQQIEKLAQKKQDAVVRQFFRETMNPSLINAAVARKIDLVGLEKIVEADQALERLRSSIDLVDNHLKQPIFAEAAKIPVRRQAGGKARGAQQSKTAAETWRPYVEQYTSLQISGMDYRTARRRVVRRMTKDEFVVPNTGEFPSEKTIAKWLPQK